MIKRHFLLYNDLGHRSINKEFLSKRTINFLTGTYLHSSRYKGKIHVTECCISFLRLMFLAFSWNLGVRQDLIYWDSHEEDINRKQMNKHKESRKKIQKESKKVWYFHHKRKDEDRKILQVVACESAKMQNCLFKPRKKKILWKLL